MSLQKQIDDLKKQIAERQKLIVRITSVAHFLLSQYGTINFRNGFQTMKKSLIGFGGFNIFCEFGIKDDDGRNGTKLDIWYRLNPQQMHQVFCISYFNELGDVDDAAFLSIFDQKKINDWVNFFCEDVLLNHANYASKMPPLVLIKNKNSFGEFMNLQEEANYFAKRAMKLMIGTLV